MSKPISDNIMVEVNFLDPGDVWIDSYKMVEDDDGNWITEPDQPEDEILARLIVWIQEFHPEAWQLAHEQIAAKEAG